jgi:hypothetical protein
LIIHVMCFVVVKVLVELESLLRPIQIGRQLGRRRKPGRFIIIANRGGLLAEVTVGMRPLTVNLTRWGNGPAAAQAARSLRRD